MADLSYFEKAKFEKLFDMGSGYVLDFSNNRFRQFVADSIGIDVYEEKYDYASGSKPRRSSPKVCPVPSRHSIPPNGRSECGNPVPPKPQASGYVLPSTLRQAAFDKLRPSRPGGASEAHACLHPFVIPGKRESGACVSSGCVRGGGVPPPGIRLRLCETLSAERHSVCAGCKPESGRGVSSTVFPSRFTLDHRWFWRTLINGMI